MGDLLLNPVGRLARFRFWQGMVLLTVITVLIVAAGALLNPFLVLLQIPAAYLYICVYGKRLHDIGTTAWWVLAIAVAAYVVSAIVVSLVGPFFIDAETLSMQAEVWERLQAGDSNGAMDGVRLIGIRTLPVNIISAVACNAALGSVFGLLPTQVHDNKHGPAPV